MKHTIYFEPDGIEGRVDDGQTILDAARDLGIDLNAVCGGKSCAESAELRSKKARTTFLHQGIMNQMPWEMNFIFQKGMIHESPISSNPWQDPGLCSRYL